MRPDHVRHEASVPRIVMAALLVCGIFPAMGLFLPSLLLPQIELSFAHVNRAELLTELVGTLASFGLAIGAPISGTLIQRYGCRRVIVAALLAFALFGAAPAILNNIWLILACRFVTGLAVSAVFVGGLSGIGTLPTELSARLLGWFMVVSGGTSVVLFPLVGMLGQQGWRPVFLLYLLALPAIVLLARVPGTLGMVERDPVAANAPREALLTFPMIRLLLLAGLIGMMMMISPVYGPLFLAELGVRDSRMLSVLPTVGAVCAMAISAVYGPIHHRLGIKGIFAVGLLGMGLALVVAGFSTGMAQLVASIAVVSAMSSMMTPNISAAAIAVSGERRGPQAIGLANGVMFAAPLVFPFIATWVRAMAGMSGLFILAGVVIAITGAAVAIAMGFRGRRLAEA